MGAVSRRTAVQSSTSERVGPRVVAARRHAPKIRRNSGVRKVRRSVGWISTCLLTAAAACGPFVTGDQTGAEGASASAGSAPDGGIAQGDGTTPQLDGGIAGAAEDGGAARQVFSAHDLRVDGLSGDVVFAHRIKAKDVNCARLVMIADSELPQPGDRDVHGGVVSADEVRVHDVEADWVRAGTLFVRQLEVK